MAYTLDKATGDIVLSGFEKGISSSPHLGIANLQGVNLQTESGEVLCSYGRVQQTQSTSTTTGTIGALDSSNLACSPALKAGQWITISGSSISGLSAGNYYITLSNNGQVNIQISATYGGSAVTGFGLTGTATYTLLRTMSTPVASATEHYGTTSYRYYILDDQGLVWVYDTATANTSNGLTWFLPDTTLLTNATGIAVLNGWVMVFANNTSPVTAQTIWCKPTVLLAGSAPGWVAFAAGILNSLAASNHPHMALVGHQSTLYYTDGNFVGSIFPTTSYAANAPNLFSYASYTAVSTTGTISSLIDGTLPIDPSQNVTRIPAVFFSAGTKPNALTVGTVYYILYSAGAGTFEVYGASSGGSALDIATGAVGVQYFNTFYPTSSSGKSTYIWSPVALTLPYFEEAQSLAEIGNLILVGTKKNTIYQWDQVNAQPTGFIPLPENNVVNMVTVNNMAYAFAGSKGNIYITNGSTASLVITIPDYCAGIAGTPSSYIEPYFTWGGAAYIRGRIYFSILDQTSTKAGNCGGIWSFVPTQNFMIGGDNAGLALRIENQNSYGSYNGYAPIILNSQDQAARGPQYWAAWVSSVSSAAYGIDFTNTTPSAAIIETDAIPVGTMLNKKTFSQIEYKLAAPLDGVSDAVSITYRQDTTSAYTAFTSSLVVESTQKLSGYYSATFEKGQWLQLQITLTPTASANSSFVRLLEIRIR